MFSILLCLEYDNTSIFILQSYIVLYLEVYISYDSSLRIYSLTFAVMKPYKVLLFAIALLTASTAFAQFNTVSHDTPRYKVSVKSATQPTPRLPDASAPSATPYSDSLQTSQQKKRIDQRQGVAYPLKHIQVTSPFGYRHDPFTGKKRMHNGLDLHARIQAPESLR